MTPQTGTAGSSAAANAARTEYHRRRSAWERQRDRHAAGCQAAAQVLRQIQRHRAHGDLGITDQTSATTVAGWLIQAYRDAILGPDAPCTASHAAAVSRAGERLLLAARTALASQTRGALPDVMVVALARSVVAEYLVVVTMLEREARP